MTMEETLHQPLRLPFAGSIDIPPPSARVAMRVQKILAALRRAENADEAIDLATLTAKMGIANPNDYDMNVDLFGAELYDQLLDALNVDEMAVAQRAMFLWAMPGGGREAAEKYLADPTWGATANRAARRSTRTRSTSK